MNKDKLNFNALDLKLSYATARNKSRLNKKAHQSTNSSSLARSRNLMNKNSAIDWSTFAQAFCTPRSNQRVSSHNQSHKKTPQTDRQFKASSHNNSFIQNLSEELEKAVQNNLALQSMIDSLKADKAAALQEQKRLTQQISKLTQSQYTAVSMRDAVSKQLADIQFQFEEFRKKVAENEKQLNNNNFEIKKQLNLLKAAQQDHLSKQKVKQQQFNEFIKQLQLQQSATKKSYLQLLNSYQQNKVQKKIIEQQNKTNNKIQQQKNKKCKQLYEKVDQLQKSLIQSQQLYQISEKKLNQQSIKRNQASNLYAQKIQDLKILMQEKQLQTKRIFSEELENMKARHKQMIKKIKDNYLKKVKQIEDISSGALKMKEKEIDLIRVSTASQIQKSKSQTTNLFFQLTQKDHAIKRLEKQIQSLDSLLEKHSQTQNQLESQNEQQRMKIARLQAQVFRLNRQLNDFKLNNDTCKLNKSKIEYTLRQKDQIIDKLQRQNYQLTDECSELVTKLQGFSLQVQDLETYIKSETLAKQSLQTHINELKKKHNQELKQNSKQNQISSLTAENVFLKRSSKQNKIRLKITEEKLREMQILLDTANEKIASFEQMNRFSSRFEDNLQRQQYKYGIMSNQFKFSSESNKPQDSILRTIDSNIIQTSHTQAKLKQSRA